MQHQGETAAEKWHLLLVYSRSSQEFRTARDSVNNRFLTNTVNNYQSCYPVKTPQFNHAETHGQGQTAPSVHSSALVFRFHKVGREMSQTKENRMLFMPATGRPPRSSLRSCSLCTNSSVWAALLWPHLEKNKCWQDRSSSWSTGSEFTHKCKQISTKAETSFCAVLELQWQHPNTTYIH